MATVDVKSLSYTWQI